MITNFGLLLLTYYVIFSFNGICSLNQKNSETRKNFINLFNAVSQRDAEKANEYLTKLKNEVENKVYTFLAIKNELERHRDEKRNRAIELVRSKKNADVGGIPPDNDIFRAVFLEDLPEVKIFVEVRNVSVKCLNNDGETPAHTAAYKGNLTILKYLVNVDDGVLGITDGWGQTILHVATEKGPLEMIKFLVDGHKMDIYKRNKIFSGNYPIHIAALRGSLNLVKYFVEDKQMDPNILNNLGQPPVFQAAQNAHLDVVKYLYENHKVNVHIIDRENKSILHMCALKADLNISKYLLDEKKLTFDINQRDSLGYTVIFWAARRKRMDFIEYFIEEKHADINIQNNEGDTPLHQAVNLYNEALIKYLYKHGAKFEIKNKNGYTPRNITDDPSIQNVLNTLIQPPLRNPEVNVTCRPADSTSSV